MRVTKDSEERRSEIVETAEKLFKENGIAKTAVSAIVKELNVAQGLFYYYFSSKDDLIDEIAKKYNDKFKDGLNDSNKQEDFDKQLNDFVDNCSNGLKEFWDKFRNDETTKDLIQLTTKTIDEVKKTASEELTKIINKGNEDEKLNIKSPEYYAKAIVGGISDLIEEGLDDIEEIKNIVKDTLKKENDDE
ncbi:MAG: TetR/AcrR family transcriptional regulator [Erysipelotrichaceae bacterium]|nr:TetR/AcrR family transcriptional regulator [Bacillota bacterium]NLP21392.1 TetR/AcrR family transcriptional regulator [Erysipelotrichaceae bacterium]HCY07005.1 hypothetical protein [Erysipelotrichaceae bacterium]